LSTKCSKRLRAILRMPRHNRAPRRELLVLGLLSRLAHYITFVVGMNTSRYRCKPTKRSTRLGRPPDKDLVGRASTQCSPRPGVIWRHEHPGPSGDPGAWNRNGVGLVLIQLERHSWQAEGPRADYPTGTGVHGAPRRSVLRHTPGRRQVRYMA